MAGCECNGMRFICNRWVFTGECTHTRAKEVADAIELQHERLFDLYGFTDDGTEEH